MALQECPQWVESGHVRFGWKAGIRFSPQNGGLWLIGDFPVRVKRASSSGPAKA